MLMFCYDSGSGSGSVVTLRDVDREGGRPRRGGLLPQPGADWLAPAAPQTRETPQRGAVLPL